MAGKSGDELSFFQIKINSKQAQHLPGAIIIDYFCSSPRSTVLIPRRRYIVFSLFDYSHLFHSSTYIRTSGAIRNPRDHKSDCERTVVSTK